MNEQELKAARLAFLNETVEFYNGDPDNRRSVMEDDAATEDSNPCMYRGPGGTCCAIGRHIPDDKYYPGLEGQPATSDAVKEVLPEAVSALGGDFLNGIQVLHDTEHYWNSSGISDDGLVWVNVLKETFELN